MITIQGIKGLCIGLEFDETEEWGFIINLDLGFFRVTWFKDLERVE